MKIFCDASKIFSSLILMNLTSIMERDLLIEAERMFVIAKSGIFLSRHDWPDGRNNKTNRTAGRRKEEREGQVGHHRSPRYVTACLL